MLSSLSIFNKKIVENLIHIHYIQYLDTQRGNMVYYK